MEHQPPQRDDRILGFEGYGLVHVIHGHGKGKSTSALGTAIRCAGAGKKVAIIYFDKGGNDHYSERAMLEKIKNIDYFVTGRDRIDKETGRFDFSIQPIDKSEAIRGLRFASECATSGLYDLIILDEINSTVALGMAQAEDVLKIIRSKKTETEMILTGRDPHETLLESAHLISRVELERHYFYSGVKAREGIDY